MSKRISFYENKSLLFSFSQLEFKGLKIHSHSCFNRSFQANMGLSNLYANISRDERNVFPLILHLIAAPGKLCVLIKMQLPLQLH